MAVTFIPNPTLPAQVKIDPGVGAALAVVGSEALAFVVDHAPVLTGRLKNSIRQESIPGNGQRISVNVDYWLFPEYGTVNMDPEPYLRPALSAIGVNLL